MAANAEEYLSAFDLWLTRHIGAASKAGRDFAFRERQQAAPPRLDDDGAAWDHAFLAPGEPSPGPSWTVYRLHGVAPSRPTSSSGPIVVAIQRRSKLADLVKTVFGTGHFASPHVQPQAPHRVH